MTVTPRRLDQRGRRLAVLALAALVAVPLLPAVASASPTQLLPYVTYGSVPEPEAVAIGDVTGDGRGDAVVTTGPSENPALAFKLAILAGQADGTLAAPDLRDTAGSYPDRPSSVGIGDINGDGRPDVAVGIDDVGVQVFPGLAGGGLGAPTLTPTADGRLIRLGQLDGTGGLDVAAIGWGSDTVTILSDSGAGLAVVHTYAAPHGGYDDLEVGDVSGDGLVDVVVMSGQGLGDNLQVLTQAAGGTLNAAVPYDLGGNELTHGVAIGDVSGDGRNDVLVTYGGNRPASRLGIFHQTTSGTLTFPYSMTSYDIPEPVEVADLDGDGSAAVVTAHGGWNAIGLYGSYGGGDLWPEQLTPVSYASHYGSQGLALGDLTGDGRPDVALADSNNGLLVLANNGPVPNPTPTFTTPPTPVPTATPVPPVPPTPTPVPPTPTPGPPTPTPVPPTPTPVPPTPTPVPVAPQAPRSLAATAPKPGQVVLTWQAPASNGGSAITGYWIYRGTSSGGEQRTVFVVAAATSYTDASVGRKVRYFYRLTAVNAAGESVPSNEVSVTSK
jgi:hypothetical protein